MTSDTERRLLLAIIALGVLLRVVVYAFTDLYLDTAYYWLWGQRFEISYFDHPPLIAWLLRLFGVSGTVALTSVLMVAGAVSLAPDDSLSRWRAAALASVTPAFIVASVVSNPDSILFGVAALALAAAQRGRLVWAGLFFGLALLSKYPAVLLLPALLVAGWRTGDRVGLLKATVVAALCCVPVVMWNMQHDWGSIHFQLHHGTKVAPGGPLMGLELLGSQLGMVGPLLFPLMLVWLVKGPPGALPNRLAALLPLVVFCAFGFVSRGEPNWPALAAVSAVPGVVAWLGQRPRLRWATMALSALVSVAGAGFLSLPTPWALKSDPFRRMHGYSVLSALSNSGAEAAMASYYGLASEVAFYAKLPVGTMKGRYSQFDLWPPLRPRAGADVLWVGEGDQPPGELSRLFERVEGPETLEGRFQSLVVHRFTVWRLVSFRGDTDLK